MIHYRHIRAKAKTMISNGLASWLRASKIDLRHYYRKSRIQEPSQVGKARQEQEYMRPF